MDQRQKISLTKLIKLKKSVPCFSHIAPFHFSTVSEAVHTHGGSRKICLRFYQFVAMASILPCTEKCSCVHVPVSAITGVEGGVFQPNPKVPEVPGLPWSQNGCHDTLSCCKLPPVGERRRP